MKEIALTKGLVALVDAADFEWLNQWKWYASGGAYAARRDVEQGRRLVYMHRVIMSPEDGLHVDHVNGITLDNRRENLRCATRSQNLANSRTRKRKHPYRGVERCNGNGRWRARLGHLGEYRHLGVYDTPEEAARAFDREVRLLYGEFAKTNFPG